MGKVTESIERAFAKAFVGRRLLTYMYHNGRQIMEGAFVVRSVCLYNDGYLSLYGDDRKNEYECVELGQAVELADKGEAQWLDDRGMLVIYMLKKEKKENEKDGK